MLDTVKAWQLGQIEYLTGLDTVDHCAREIVAAAPTGRRGMHDRHIRVLHSLKRLPGDPGCPPGLRPDGRRKLFGAGFSYPSEDGGRDEFREL